MTDEQIIEEAKLIVFSRRHLELLEELAVQKLGLGEGVRISPYELLGLIGVAQREAKC